MDAFQFQYLVGGAVFLVGLGYAYRQGYIGFSGRGARNLVILLAGLTFFMVIQGYPQYAPMETAPEVRAAGELDRSGVIGVTAGRGA